MSFGGDSAAKIIYQNLKEEIDFEIPIVDLSDPIFDMPGGSDSDIYKPVSKLTNEDLTTRVVKGDGSFDALMEGTKAHLKEEYDKGRITGAEYTRAYIELTQSVMGNATQFLLGRDAAYWQAQLAQVQAITGRVQLQIARVQLAQTQFDALTAKANFTLALMKLATEDVTYGAGKKQVDLLKEQIESQRAQTMNTRTDGVNVEGTLGKQRDLYDQQITSYQRDAEVKAAKLFTDAWTVQKTIDEGLNPPSGFANPSIDEVLTAIKSNNNLD